MEGPNKKSIIDMARGAIKERADYEMTRVVENILDPNTSATAARKITIIVMSVLPMFTITRWPASTCTTRPRAEEVLYAYCRLDFAAGGTGLHLPALR